MYMSTHPAMPTPDTPQSAKPGMPLAGAA